MTAGQELEEVSQEIGLLRQEVVVLRESIDEFRDELTHVLRMIRDDNLLTLAAFEYREFLSPDREGEEPDQVDSVASLDSGQISQAKLFD